ncbi:hypothetical protein Cob_v005686 [Colletotrichum orbiculare MAFF 240422]|uniref:Formylmethionine deformylase-like protein n=1 Tax=Colletotrichum orbiculare (strain 104-T / ATCC 96160 / CBS 514.97 / LARS 414 / MAFF 240422) TaxID=1213857 RepID=N4VFF3_COLOR|nr:hypothetical protein Cob_v005686 [Colletotrichum orbiculare MAFF 240422]
MENSHMARHSLDISRCRDSGFASVTTLASKDAVSVSKASSRIELLPKHGDLPDDDSDRYTPAATPTTLKRWDTDLLPHDLWNSAWNMYFFFVTGVAFALGHHIYYQSLEGRLVRGEEQLTSMRYGTALAFAAKASFATAVFSAFREQLWAVVRAKLFKISTLDDMFAAPETPLALMNWEFLSRAKTAAALATLCWLSPLAVILTTSTLVVMPATEVQNTTCPGVRTLNFRFEDTTDWRNGGKIEDLSQMSLSYWNNTSKDKSDPYFFDYYTAPSENAEEFMHASTYLQRPIVDQENAFEVCERGWNCSVEISFVGPAYKCAEIARGIGNHSVLVQSSGTVLPPFSMNDLAPTGNFTYIAWTLLGEYGYLQMARMKKGGIPVMEPPYPEHLGAFRTEPVIWIGYSELNDTFTRAYLNSSEPVQNPEAFTPVIVACEHYEANYTAELIYRDGMQLPRIKDRKFLAPVINTTYIPDLQVNDGTMDKTVAVPESNYILPQDIKTYRRTAGYHSMGLFLRTKLNGTIMEPGKVEETGVVQTSLIDHRFHFVRPNVIGLIETWYGNLLMSMFARPRFQAVVWAAKTEEQTGTRRKGVGPEADYLYPCVRSRPAVRYHYRTSILVGVYGVLVSLALLGIVVGSLAVRRNGGVSRDMRFSSIVEATRGTALDKLSWGGSASDYGNDYGDPRRVKVGYGMLTEYESTSPLSPRFGFGVKGDVTQG